MVKFTRHPMYLLDKWAHSVRLPKILQHPICNAFDEWVGLYDDDNIYDADDEHGHDCD